MKEHETNSMNKKGYGSKHQYKSLLIMLLIHFVVMFAVMYTMVYSISDVFINLNQFYMTAMMVAPMTFSMLLLMSSMYQNKKLNYIYYGTSAVAFVLFFIFMRAQSFIGDRQFLKSMIPHHSGAVLMCGKASISDPEIIQLCSQIIESQNREIDQMKKILERL